MNKLRKRISNVFQKQKGNQEQGSSLLEVTVALLVANIGLLGVAQLISVATVMNKNSSNMVESSRAAQKIIEPLRAKDFSQLAVQAPTTTKYNDRYDVTTTIENIGTGAVSKKITVKVEDKNYDMKKGERSFSFVNYRTIEKQTTNGSYYNSALTVQGSTGTPNANPSPSTGYPNGTTGS